MKQYKFLFVLIATLALAALACNGGAQTPTAIPQADDNPPPTSEPSATEAPLATEMPATQDSQFGGSSDLVTFTDANNLFSFDLPGDWVYSDSFNDDDGVYVDRFESPDTSGFIENITGFSKVPLTGGSNGKVALYFIHKYYSTTGKQGDIRVTDDKLQSDGSERLKWESKSGGYSGISYFEVRGDDRKTFLMFTVWWNDGADQSVLDTIDAAITSYHIP